MGKPEPHCDPRDPLPYQKYFEPFDNLLTTTVAPDNYVVYPSSVSCPDLRPRPCPTDFQLDCPPLSGYEVLLYNNCDVCKEVTFNIKDDVCSRGGLVQQHCCDGARYHTFLVSGDSLTVNLKARTEFRKIYGNFENVQISDPSDCYRYPHVFVNSCTPNHDYILWSDCQTIDIGCSLYKNLVGEIIHFFKDRVSACVAAGISHDRLILDIGFGFGKSPDDNLRLINRLPEFSEFGLPLLVGLSRKSTISRIAEDLLSASLAGALVAVERGARIIRVHDVSETVAAIRVWRSIQAEKVIDE